MVNVCVWDYTQSVAKLMAGPTTVTSFPGEDSEGALVMAQALVVSVLAEDGVHPFSASVNDDSDNIFTIVLDNADHSHRMAIVVTRSSILPLVDLPSHS